MKPLATVRNKERTFELHADHAVMKTARRTVVVRVGETYEAKYAGSGKRKARTIKVLGFEFERGAARVVHDGEGKNVILFKNFVDLYVLALPAGVLGKSPYQAAIDACAGRPPEPVESSVRIVPSLPSVLPHKPKSIPKTTVEDWCLGTCELGEELQKLGDEIAGVGRDLERRAWKAWEAASGDGTKKTVKPALDIAHALKSGPVVDKLRAVLAKMKKRAGDLLDTEEERKVG